jgi:two-component system LytT family response regulator
VRPHAPAAAGAGAGAGAKPTAQVLVNSRGRREWIAIADVDWIESQGNYVTLHVGTRTHWVRQSLGAFETQLDRTRFARIHRRTIVALDRIRDIQAEGNGDASIRLQDGSTLRVSRRYRKDLGDRWLGFRAAR